MERELANLESHDVDIRRFNKITKIYPQSKFIPKFSGLSPDLQNMEQIRRIMRPTDVPDTGLLCDLLWYVFIVRIPRLKCEIIENRPPFESISKNLRGHFSLTNITNHPYNILNGFHNSKNRAIFQVGSWQRCDWMGRERQRRFVHIRPGCCREIPESTRFGSHL